MYPFTESVISTNGRTLHFPLRENKCRAYQVRNFIACCYMCHRATNLKEQKCSRLPILPSLIIKKVVQCNGRALSIQPQIPKNILPKCHNLAKKIWKMYCICFLSHCLGGFMTSWIEDWESRSVSGKLQEN